MSYEGHFVAPPPVFLDPPPMDLGRFEISKGPSDKGGLNLGPFSKSNRPSRRGGLDLGLFEKSNRPSNDVEFPSKSPINRLKTLFLPTRCARGGHFSGTDPVFVSQGRWSMIPSGVCDLVYCGAGCLGLSRGGLDLGLFRKSNRPSRRGGLDIGLSKRANPSTRGGVVQSNARIKYMIARYPLYIYGVYMCVF